MIKKILSVMIVVSLVFAVCASGLSASALVDTSITYGDYDGNGKVEISDASAVLKVAGLQASITDDAVFKRCDINSDGVITIFDARQILRSCASHLATIQPTGEFAGFEGGGVFGSAEDAVNYFNLALNKVKTDKPGFLRSETADVKDFYIGDAVLAGYTVGESASSVSEMIKNMIVSESEPEGTLTSIKGENCDNAMSVETEEYVSKLSADEVLGVRCAKDDETGILTIEIALPDSELDNVSQTAIGDVLNAQILQENMDTIVGNVFGAGNGGDTTRKTIKNCLLTATFDTSNGHVLSYVTSYTTETYISETTLGLKGGILSVDLSDVEYKTAISVIYDINEY